MRPRRQIGKLRRGNGTLVLGEESFSQAEPYRVAGWRAGGRELSVDVLAGTGSPCQGCHRGPQRVGLADSEVQVRTVPGIDLRGISEGEESRGPCLFIVQLSLVTLYSSRGYFCL